MKKVTYAVTGAVMIVIAPLVAGTWRVCGHCREGPQSQGIRSHEGAGKTRSGDPTASNIARLKKGTVQ